MHYLFIVINHYLSFFYSFFYFLFIYFCILYFLLLSFLLLDSISGGLPPDARKDQARLFSDPNSGYDVLVASDAIGMGLNLSIKRIVFSTIDKYDGRVNRKLYPAVSTFL